MTETINVTTETTVPTAKPTITASAQITAPEVAANQADFQAENPNLFVMTVADYNEVLKEAINKVLEKFWEDGDISASTARYEDNVSYVTNDDVAVTISVICADFEGAHATGSLLVSDLIELTDTMTRHLVTDPLSEHRREHVAELMEDEREANRDNPDFDEAAVMDVYNRAPLGALCAMSLANKALPSILAGFYPASDSPFGGSYDDQPRRTGFWGQVRDFFTN